MRRHLREILRRTVVPILGGAAFGAMAAAVYALLCAVLYWLITGQGNPVAPLLIRFTAAGAAAGAIVGFCLVYDWATCGADLPVRSGQSPNNPCEAGSSGNSKLSALARIQPVGSAASPVPEAVSGSLSDHQQLLARLTACGGRAGGAASMSELRCSLLRLCSERKGG
jgi:hypothetical protein